MNPTDNSNACGTQLGTQPGTQLDPQTLHEDEMAHADTALILRVLDRHRLDQTWLALECNLSKSYVSRVLSGSHPVPHDMVRRMFQSTGDVELLDLFSGTTSRYRVTVLDRHLIQADAIRPTEAVGEALILIARSSTCERGSREYASLVREALNKLAAADYGLNGPERIAQAEADVRHAMPDQSNRAPNGYTLTSPSGRAIATA